MYNNLERKKYKRIEKPYRARFKIRSDEAQEMEAYVLDSVTLHNLSAGSAAFIYNKNLGIGTLLDLKIDVSKSTPTINCVGKIIRIDKPQPTSMFCIAVFFVDIGELEKAMINTSVAEDLEYEDQTSLT
jgi:hypothetical protein